jgi:hypothetical protein
MAACHADQGIEHANAIITPRLAQLVKVGRPYLDKSKFDNDKKFENDKTIAKIAHH